MPITARMWLPVLALLAGGLTIGAANAAPIRLRVLCSATVFLRRIQTIEHIRASRAMILTTPSAASERRSKAGERETLPSLAR